MPRPLNGEKTNGTGETGCPRLIMKRHPYITPYTKHINSKWTQDPNIRPERIIILEEKIGKIIRLDLTMISWIRHEKHRQQKQKEANEAT